MDDLAEEAVAESAEIAPGQAADSGPEPAPELVAEPEPAPEAEPEVEPEPEPEPESAPESTPEVEPEVEPEPAPESTAEVEPEPVVEQAVIAESPEETQPRVPWWPFVLYGLLWIALIAYAGTQVSTAQGAAPAVEQAVYPYVVLAGMVIMLMGPLASIIVWIVIWVRAGKGRRGGLLTTALVRGSMFTLFGVVAWWCALYVLDALRLGLIGPIG